MSGAVRSHSHCEIARDVMPRYSASCSCVISFSRRNRLIVEPTDIFCPPKSIQKRFCDFIISDFKKHSTKYLLIKSIASLCFSKILYHKQINISSCISVFPALASGAGASIARGCPPPSGGALPAHNRAEARTHLPFLYEKKR